MAERLRTIAKDPESWKLVAQLTSTLVALVALYLTVRSERRSRLRFQHQLDLSERLIEANVRPFLAVTTLTYENHRGLELTNHGVGLAVIRKVTFRRGKSTATSAAGLLELKRDFDWDDCTDYKSGPFYHRSQETDTLVELTLQVFLTLFLASVVILLQLPNRLGAVEGTKPSPYCLAHMTPTNAQLTNALLTKFSSTTKIVCRGQTEERGQGRGNVACVGCQPGLGCVNFRFL
jgi:hypothetical protein